MSTPQNLETRIREGWAHYLADVEWRCPADVKNAAANLVPGRTYATTVVAHAPSADSALRQVHQVMQRTKENNTERRVMRPMLSPADYTVKKLYIPYKDCASGPDKPRELEHVFDLPAGTNPDIRPDPTPAQATATMTIFDEAKGQGRLSE